MGYIYWKSFNLFYVFLQQDMRYYSSYFNMLNLLGETQYMLHVAGVHSVLSCYCYLCILFLRLRKNTLTWRIAWNSITGVVALYLSMPNYQLHCYHHNNITSKGYIVLWNTRNNDWKWSHGMSGFFVAQAVAWFIL